MKYYGSLSIYGSDIPIASMGIVMKVSSIIFSIIFGIAIGAQPILGFNYGAKKYNRVINTYKLEILLSSIISIIGFIFFVFFPNIIIPIFGKSNNPLYNEFLNMTFRIYLSATFIVGFQVCSSLFFQAIGKPMKSVIFSMSRQILLLLPLIFILPKFFGIKGILYAGPISDIATSILTYIFIFKEIKKLKIKEKLNNDTI